MITSEPLLRVGILEHRKEVRWNFGGRFIVNGAGLEPGEYGAFPEESDIVVRDAAGRERARGRTMSFTPDQGAAFTVRGVTIGIQFHWERTEDETFNGGLTLLTGADGMIVVVNEIPVEEYLKSVISSEMSAESPPELLKAHAVTSRSWLVAMLERERWNVGVSSRRSFEKAGEIIRWYDREDHALFDVCADDHCQRYQGISKIVSPEVQAAVDATRGLFLISGDQICDARFSKSCGGITEEFQNVWEPEYVPYLSSLSDSRDEFPAIRTEAEADMWIRSSPAAYCNTTNGRILRQVLPSFDQETTDFFRWRVSYAQDELSDLIRRRSGIDFGAIRSLVPVDRGPSGRIIRLKTEGTRQTLTVGKELEIRRWLSRSHLYSSAFVVDTEPGVGGIPARFHITGAGWGHGVGLCQIGAAVMATRGFTAEQILLHYFRNASLTKCY